MDSEWLFTNLTCTVSSSRLQTQPTNKSTSLTWFQNKKYSSPGYFLRQGMQKGRSSLYAMPPGFLWISKISFPCRIQAIQKFFPRQKVPVFSTSITIATFIISQLQPSCYVDVVSLPSHFHTPKTDIGFYELLHRKRTLNCY